MSGRTKQITKCGNMHCDWFILPLLLPTLTIWFSLDHKRNISDGVGRNGNVLILPSLSSSVTLTPIRFSPGHKRSYSCAYDSNSDSITRENQP